MYDKEKGLEMESGCTHYKYQPKKQEGTVEKKLKILSNNQSINEDLIK